VNARDADDVAVGKAAARVERVKVPVGTFETVRVDSEVLKPRQGFGFPIQMTEWYAPGVGVVQRTAYRGLWVLKSFTPGKD
jgi:hypothetical protein